MTVQCLKKYILLPLLLLFCLNSNAFGASDSLEISLLTFSNKEEVHGAFGHTSVRVKDFKLGTDVTYDYGVFNFEEPGFLLKFLRGKLLYFVGRYPTKKAYYRYNIEADRRIFEQKLNLDQADLQKVATALEENYKPENRYYHYDFFFDNCATRIRDILESSLGDKLVYESTGKTGKTLRQLLDVYVKQRPWLDFGIDLILGLPADQDATFQTQMFLPEFLSSGLTEKTLIKTATGEKPLLGSPKVTVDVPVWRAEKTFFTPFNVLSIVCVLVFILSLIFNHNRLLAIIDGTLFLLLGIMGGIMLFMWLGTDHDATKWNLNVLWASPLYLVFFAGVMRQKTQAMLSAYGLATLTGIITLLAWKLLPQQFHLAVIPIVLMLLVRSGSVFLHLRKRTK